MRSERRGRGRSVFAGLATMALAGCGALGAAAAEPAAAPAGGPWPIAAPFESALVEAEGTVAARVVVGDDGAPRAVDVAAAPAKRADAAEAVRAALARWRFPESAGKTVELSFAIPTVRSLSHARVFAATPKEAFAAAVRVLEGAGIGAAVRDDEAQVYVSEWIAFRKRNPRLPAAPVLDRGWRADRFRLHVFVPPLAEPARVQVNAVIDAESVQEGFSAKYYSLGLVEAWFLARMEEALQAPGYAIPLDAAARRALVAVVDPAAVVADRCGSGTPRRAGEKDAPPELLAATQVWPAQPVALRRARPAPVHLVLTVAEDGVVERIAASGDDATAAKTVRNAAALWRFRPARRDGCPVAAQFEVDQPLRPD